MASFRRNRPGGPEVTRAPAMSSGIPPSRPPPRVEGPAYTRGAYESDDGSPYRYTADSGAVHRPTGRRSPERYIDAPPPGYQDSPPRRFPGRRNPAHHLSPEGSPPYRYIEDAPQRHRGSPRHPGDSARAPQTGGGYQAVPPRRFGGGPSVGYPGYRNERFRYSDSDSPSPPGHFFPPPPPPGGIHLDDESPSRFEHSPVDYSRYDYDDHRRQFGALHDRSPPSPVYPDEPPRRFGGYANEPPRRFAGGSPPNSRDKKFSTSQPTRPPRPAPEHDIPPSPRRLTGAPYSGQAEDARLLATPALPAPPIHGGEILQRPGAGAPQPARPVPYGALPGPGTAGEVRNAPTGRPAASPPRLPGPAADRPIAGGPFPPAYGEDLQTNFPGTPPQRLPDGSPQGYATPTGYNTPGSSGYNTPLGFATTPPPHFADGSPAQAGAVPLDPARLARDMQGKGTAPPSVPAAADLAAAAVARRHGTGSAGASPTGRSPGVQFRSSDDSSDELHATRDLAQDGYGANATPPRAYRQPPPLRQGAGLLPPGFISPEYEYERVGPRRHPDGYTARTPPRQPPPRRTGLGDDAIFTADVVPIELDDKLKEVQPHEGNPGSSTGGGWRDSWAAILFILHIVAIVVLSVLFAIEGITKTIERYDEPRAYHITHWFPQLAAAAITGAVFACIWQTAIRVSPVIMISVTVWTAAALMALFGIVLVATGQSAGLIGLFFLFLAICQALYAFIIRERIPFAGDMLKKVIAVCGKYPSTYFVSYFTLLVSMGWLAIWIVGLSGSAVRPRHVAIMVGYIASLIWTMHVLRNIVHVTVAGTVSLFYFQERNMPRMPTSLSLLKACTTSFGSICLGSFFVPLVEAPTHALRRINAQAGASEFFFSCVVCFIAIYERLIRYMNRLGYIQVAIYGKPFIRAARDTWDMLQVQAVDVLLYDDLISTFLFVACGAGGSLSALVGGIWTFIEHKSLTIVISLISFLIGVLMSYIAMAVFESGVATYYVCFAQDPETLQRQDGPLYEKMWVRQMELQSPLTELTA